MVVLRQKTKQRNYGCFINLVGVGGWYRANRVNEIFYQGRVIRVDHVWGWDQPCEIYEFWDINKEIMAVLVI